MSEPTILKPTDKITIKNVCFHFCMKNVDPRAVLEFIGVVTKPRGEEEC